MGAIQLPPKCHTSPGCLDYRNFIFPIPPATSSSGYARLDQGLRQLGEVTSQGLGVVRIGGHWGFLVIPPDGFPEIRISFYRHTETSDIQRLLEQVSRMLRGLDQQEGADNPEQARDD